MIIRTIREEDLDALLLLFKEFASFEKAPEKMQNNNERMKKEKQFLHGYVAMKDAELIGYVTYYLSYHTWVGKTLYMDDLYVTPAYRGQKTGTHLIEKVINRARQEECHELRWQVSNWNQKAIRFYEKMGARINDVELNCHLNLSNA